MKMTLLKFSSPTCGPCKAMHKVVKTFIEKYSNVTLKEIDVDTVKGSALADRYGVQAVPTFFFLYKKESVLGPLIGMFTFKKLESEYTALVLALTTQNSKND
jgi:thiol-disulfide isomerase/thioredoxin